MDEVGRERLEAAGEDESVRVLLVDDDPLARELYRDLLAQMGHCVATAPDAPTGVALLEHGAFDVVLADITLPGGLDGLDLLRRVKQLSPDLPVVLLTASPTLETAVRAVDDGAFAYLSKPIDLPTLAQVAARAARNHRVEQRKRAALELLEEHEEVGRGEALRFTQAMRTLHLVFQPIVCWEERRVFAYEALVRAIDPFLSSPLALLSAAEQLGRLPEIGREVRAAAARAIPRLPKDVSLFVNLHTADLSDEQLFSPTAPLSRVSERVVLEITERASIEQVGDFEHRIAALRGLGFRLAVDDLGAGYSGLTNLTRLAPDFVKLDMFLARHIDREPTKQRVVGAMLKLSAELNMRAISEGVERPAERDQLAMLGCSLQQGFLFAPPAPTFIEPAL